MENRRWYDQNVDQVLSSERRLYSLKWKIAGTVDLVAKMKNGRTAVIDWKGVTDLDASIKAGHIGQLTAYREMLTEAGEKIDDCILVRFSRANGKVDALVLKDHQANIDAFEAALHLARYTPQTENF